MSLVTLEMICAPYAIWLAPVGTEFPDVDEDPTGMWALLGTSGAKSYDSKGVTVTFNETIGKFQPALGTGNRKVWRTAEEVSLGADLADLSVATFAKVMNDAIVTNAGPDMGVPGTSSFPLLKGPDVALFAALARGISPEEEGMVAQFQLPIAYQNGNLAPVLSQSGPAMLAVNLSTLEDDDLGFGEFVAQTANAS